MHLTLTWIAGSQIVAVYSSGLATISDPPNIFDSAWCWNRSQSWNRLLFTKIKHILQQFFISKFSFHSEKVWLSPKDCVACSTHCCNSRHAMSVQLAIIKLYSSDVTVGHTWTVRQQIQLNFIKSIDKKISHWCQGIIQSLHEHFMTQIGH